MMTRCCLILIAVVIQFTSSQVIPYGAPNRPINVANNGRGMLNGVAMGRGMPTGLPMANNQITRTFPLGANNMANSNLVNAQNFPNNNPYYANNNLANNLAYGNLANGAANPAITNANQVLANEMTVTALVKESLANGNLKPNVATSAIQANNIAEPINPYVGTGNIANAIAYTSMANDKNPNVVSYNFGNDAIPITITGDMPSNLPIGIRILADNLEVSGAVSVIGKMPIYGAVALNGNLPTDGMASVNYNCGKPTAV